MFFGNDQYESLSLGKDLAYPLREDPDTGDLAQASEEESVRSGVRLIAELSRGDVPGSELAAAGLREVLFEDAEVAADISVLKLHQAILDYFPQLTDVTVTPSVNGNSLTLAVTSTLRMNGQQLFAAVSTQGAIQQ